MRLDSPNYFPLQLLISQLIINYKQQSDVIITKRNRVKAMNALTKRALNKGRGHKVCWTVFGTVPQRGMLLHEYQAA